MESKTLNDLLRLSDRRCTTCPICFKDFAKSGNRNRHMKDTHEVTLQEFRAPLLDRMNQDITSGRREKELMRVRTDTVIIGDYVSVAVEPTDNGTSNCLGNIIVGQLLAMAGFENDENVLWMRIAKCAILCDTASAVAVLLDDDNQLARFTRDEIAAIREQGPSVNPGFPLFVSTANVFWIATDIGVGGELSLSRLITKIPVFRVGQKVVQLLCPFVSRVLGSQI